MSLIDGDLAALFGAAFAMLYRDATLKTLTRTDDGSGGFGTAFTTAPVKVLVESMSERARAVSGLPDPAVTLSVLRAGLSVGIDLDDEITVAGITYRVIRVAADAAGAAWSLVAVPV